MSNEMEAEDQKLFFYDETKTSKRAFEVAMETEEGDGEATLLELLKEAAVDSTSSDIVRNFIFLSSCRFELLSTETENLYGIVKRYSANAMNIIVEFINNSDEAKKNFMEDVVFQYLKDFGDLDDFQKKTADAVQNGNAAFSRICKTTKRSFRKELMKSQQNVHLAKEQMEKYIKLFKIAFKFPGTADYASTIKEVEPIFKKVEGIIKQKGSRKTGKDPKNSPVVVSSSPVPTPVTGKPLNFDKRLVNLENELDVIEFTQPGEIEANQQALQKVEFEALKVAHMADEERFIKLLIAHKVEKIFRLELSMRMKAEVELSRLLRQLLNKSRIFNERILEIHMCFVTQLVEKKTVVEIEKVMNIEMDSKTWANDSYEEMEKEALATVKLLQKLRRVQRQNLAPVVKVEVKKEEPVAESSSEPMSRNDVFKQLEQCTKDLEKMQMRSVNKKKNKKNTRRIKAFREARKKASENQ